MHPAKTLLPDEKNAFLFYLNSGGYENDRIDESARSIW
jgi:hypothetical protein